MTVKTSDMPPMSPAYLIPWLSVRYLGDDLTAAAMQLDAARMDEGLGGALSQGPRTTR
jgi:hypothetical protein